MAANLTLFTVDAILILDAEGRRILTKYYSPPHKYADGAHENPFPTLKDQKVFERGLFAKTHKQNTDIVLFDNRIVVYKEAADTIMYVVGAATESETLLYQVVVGLRDALEILLRHSVDKRTILDNFDLVSIAVDELVDGGIILETDPTVIASRVTRAPTQETTVRDLDLSERGLLNAYQLAKEKLAERIRQSL